MLGKLPPFDYHRPSTMEEALSLMEKLDGNVSLLAGGTDLLVAMKIGRLRHRTLVDIKHIPNLGAIRAEDGGLCLGAAVNTRTIANAVSKAIDVRVIRLPMTSERIHEIISQR